MSGTSSVDRRHQNLYFIAVVPHEELRDRVRQLKEEMRDRFGARHALKSPAHITLQMPFKRTAEIEPEIEETLAAFARNQQPFRVALDGFDCFAPRVIFIRIREHRPLQELSKKLNSVLRDQLDFPPHELKDSLHPHLTIATRDLKKAAFADAWPEFRKREFTAVFDVDKISLLKHNSRHWEIFRQFSFQ